jgi:uracil-DNA glycosylase
MDKLPDNWKIFLEGYTDMSRLEETLEWVNTRREQHVVYPPAGSIFRAFSLTAPERVRAVIIGQDPYHEPGQAQGLAFSVPEGVKLPPSLKNIFKEYVSDTGNPLPGSGDLTAWAKEGVLLMNAVLSVDQGAAASHAKKAGWEIFTDSVIRALSAEGEQIAFILWGNFAIGKRELIDETRHLVLESVHPSPLSARRGFFGSSPFSKVSAYNGVNWLLQS